MKKLISLIAIILYTSYGFGQNNINNYKYVIIPATYEFLGEKDKYQLNSLTKFLFNKHGYTAFMEGDAIPQELKDNMCLAMHADLENINTLFKIKVKLHLKDCGGNLIMSSKEGETREKLYEKGYNIALRQAFETFQFADYHYALETKNERVHEVPIPTELEVDEHPETERLIVAVNEDINKEQALLKHEVDNETIEMPVSIQTEKESIEKETENKNELLYAQPIENGYQIVDTEPKKVMVLYRSGIDDVFIVEGVDAIVYKKNGEWIYEEFTSKLEAKTLNIKF